MKSFFEFLSQELAATMVALAGLVASVAAIADAIKKNKKDKMAVCVAHSRTVDFSFIAGLFNRSIYRSVQD